MFTKLLLNREIEYAGNQWQECLFSAKIWFAKTSTWIAKYKSQVVKSNPGQFLKFKSMHKIQRAPQNVSISFYVLHKTTETSFFNMRQKTTLPEYWGQCRNYLWFFWSCAFSVFLKFDLVHSLMFAIKSIIDCFFCVLLLRDVNLRFMHLP